MTAINSIKWFVAIVLVTCSVVNAHSGEATTIDAVRAAYLQLEAELWDHVENGVDQSSVLNQICAQHRNMFEKNFTLIDQDENDFFLLEKIFEWNILKQNLMPIRSLYETFPPILKKNRDKFDRLELTDLAETVVSETDQINNTLEEIENYMIKQGVYYKVMLVCGNFFFVERFKSFIFLMLSFCGKTVFGFRFINFFVLYFFTVLGITRHGMHNQAVGSTSIISNVQCHFDY